MQHSSRRRAAAIPLFVALLALGAAACGRAGATAQSEPDYGEPAKVVPVEGTALSKVILTQRAAERLGIQTAEIRQAQAPPVKGGGLRKVIPYAAVLYDENGDTWTFTNPADLTFVRQKVKVDYIEGDRSFLLDGPPAGTKVVTVGAVELLGAELGVGEG
jgi:hypothetical protein